MEVYCAIKDILLFLVYEKGKWEDIYSKDRHEGVVSTAVTCLGRMFYHSLQHAAIPID